MAAETGYGRPVNLNPSSSPSLPNTGAATRQLRSDYDGRNVGTAHAAHTQAVSDPRANLTGYMTSFHETGRILVGTVVDGTALANCYRVHPDHGTCALVATAIGHTSHSCIGVTALNTYAPGSRVLLSMHDKDHKAVIIGSIPSHIDVGRRAMHDYISQATRKRVDDCHKKHLKQPEGGQIGNYLPGRPFDATLASEWGAISTTGAAITLDDFMLRASVNEFCGMYAFYHDSLLRLAGYNLQFWTAGHERDAVMDQAEYNDIQGYTPYPWENFGVLNPGTEVIQQYEPENYQCSSQQPYYSRWENKHEFAQPFHRTIDFYGYLGQGHRRVVQAPPPGRDWWTYDGQVGSPGGPPFDSPGWDDAPCSAGPKKLTNHQADDPVLGFAEQNIAVDGRIFFASAKGITLLKRVLLPIPHRVRRPEDVKNGDDATTNYKAAGKYGKGDPHLITGDIKTTDNEYPNLQRAAAVMDLHGYLFNYAGLHPFYWHAKDYMTWEQSDIKHAQANQRVPDFQQLAGSMYLKEESPKKLRVDHRYNEQNFYETECYVSLLEDGGVVIGDGYGAEIRMSAGCVTISAPGDVWLKGGRDVQTWAGNDAIVKANKSIDISSTQKNIRIKAEEHLMLFGGNDFSESGGGRGGVLIESRGLSKTYDFEKPGDTAEFGGIVLRAPYSNVIGIGNEIYLRTAGEKSKGIQAGSIILDADKGEKELVTVSKNIYQLLHKEGKVFQFFGSEDKYKKTNMFGQNFTLLCGPIGTDADIIAGGNFLARKNIILLEGHIVTLPGGPAAPTPDDAKKKIDEALQKIEDAIEKDLPEAGDKIKENYLDTLWYDELRAGNDRVIETIGFSFRTEDDYNIKDFLLYEDRWQQLARLSGKQTEKWAERGVSHKATNDKTYPFPGKKWLIDEKVFKTQNFQIAEYANGGIKDKDRGESPNLIPAYAKPEFKQPEQPTAIDNNYPIIPRG